MPTFWPCGAHPRCPSNPSLHDGAKCQALVFSDTNSLHLELDIICFSLDDFARMLSIVFFQSKPCRRKVHIHFTIPLLPKVLCFYNQNHRHRKVGGFQEEKINIFLISLLKTFPLYDDGGFDCKNIILWEAAES